MQALSPLTGITRTPRSPWAAQPSPGSAPPGDRVTIQALHRATAPEAPPEKACSTSVGLAIAFLTAAAAAAGMTAPASAQAQFSVSAVAQPMGASGEAVERLQEGLGRLSPLRVSGVLDAQTEAAIRRFQEQHGLFPSGGADDATLGVLFNELFWQRGEALSLRPDLPQAGPLKVVVELGRQRASLVEEATGQVVRSYAVSTGAAGHRTPTGHFTISEVTRRPTWTPPAAGWARNLRPMAPGPRNPMGPAKLRLGHTSILFHGTPPENFASLGRKPASHGCIRMYPQDVWDLQRHVGPGTTVEVVE